MAAADCTSEADQLNDNSRVGYYVDDDGFLRYKPTASINMSFYQTSAAVGKSGAEVLRRAYHRIREGHAGQPFRGAKLFEKAYLIHLL